MGRGGKRRGAGRPPGASTKKTRAIANAAAAATGETPLDYMLNVLRDPKATVERKDDMAKASAAFCHPKLNAVASLNPPDSGNCITTVQILSIPRGCFLSKEQIDNPGLLLEHAQPAPEPFKPSPDFIEPAPVETAPVVAVEPVVAEDEKLAILDLHRPRKRSGEDGPAGFS